MLLYVLQQYCYLITLFFFTFVSCCSDARNCFFFVVVAEIYWNYFFYPPSGRIQRMPGEGRRAVVYNSQAFHITGVVMFSFVLMSLGFDVTAVIKVRTTRRHNSPRILFSLSSLHLVHVFCRILSIWLVLLPPMVHTGVFDTPALSIGGRRCFWLLCFVFYFALRGCVVSVQLTPHARFLVDRNWIGSPFSIFFPPRLSVFRCWCCWYILYDKSTARTSGAKCSKIYNSPAPTAATAARSPSYIYIYYILYTLPGTKHFVYEKKKKCILCGMSSVWSTPADATHIYRKGVDWRPERVGDNPPHTGTHTHTQQQQYDTHACTFTSNMYVWYDM